MKKSLIFLSFMLLNSCFTSPKSYDTYAEDMEIREKIKSVDYRKGRPIYIEVDSYPQLLPGGHIWQGGTLLLRVGEETIDFNKLIEKYKGKK